MLPEGGAHEPDNVVHVEFGQMKVGLRLRGFWQRKYREQRQNRGGDVGHIKELSFLSFFPESKDFR